MTDKKKKKVHFYLKLFPETFVYLFSINLKHITDKAINFTVNEASFIFFHLKIIFKKCLSQNYRNVSLGKLNYIIFARIAYCEDCESGGIKIKLITILWQSYDLHF